MSEYIIMRVKGRLGVASWTHGFMPTPLPPLKTEQEFLLHLVWLERHGRSEEADQLLERYCRR
jgi:hypothetical protein